MTKLQDGVHYLQFLKGRRSRRQFGSGDVPIEILNRIVQAVGWAPSPHKTRPWRFVLVSTPAVKKLLIHEMAAVFEKDLKDDGILSEERIQARIQKSLDLLLPASALLLACLYKEDLDHYPDAFRQKCEETMGAQSLGAAVQNILLAAHAENVASCWVCAPLFCPDVIQSILDLPTNFHPHILVAFGLPPNDEPPARSPFELSILHR